MDCYGYKQLDPSINFQNTSEVVKFEEKEKRRKNQTYREQLLIFLSTEYLTILHN